MTTNQTSVPGDADVQALEQRLAALYAELPHGQQAALEMLLAAGLQTLDTGDNDTAGYSLHELDGVYQARRLEMQRAWRQADRLGALGDPPERAGGAGRGVLQPVIEFFRRAGAAQPQQRPAGEAPA